MKIVSLFSGAGGLDLGFKKAGFDVIWANEFDSVIWDTFEHNHPQVTLDKRSITAISPADVPDCIGIIGGPPCQSWSEAGAGRGIDDSRGQLFFDYIRLLKAKKPLFFLAENVPGILFAKHKAAFHTILHDFTALGYNVAYFLLNAHDYGVAQDRSRVIIVGYDKKMGKTFVPPLPILPRPVLSNVIADLHSSKPAKEKNYTNGEENLCFSNHEYMTGKFSSHFMSRNRVRQWDEASFTIQASGRHIPIHPKAPKMVFVEKDKRMFVADKKDLYRRLTIRECARIQTFPDNFLFKYNKLENGYKMVGNAVPVEFARHLATVIYKDVGDYLLTNSFNKKPITNHKINYDLEPA
ncbi:MAG: DNA cytosine methyltransferase [Methylococcaceae bacterium]|nr:DNA cytosine methyltransferase [Methylococcaceae bacterium]